MYSEITKQAFDHLVAPDTECLKVEEKGIARKRFYNVFGVRVMAILSHVSQVEQYYIQDINA